MTTVIEMEYMRAQIAQAKAIHEHLPTIITALQTIAAHLETIAVSSEAWVDDNFPEPLAEVSLDRIATSLEYVAQVIKEDEAAIQNIIKETSA